MRFNFFLIFMVFLACNSNEPTDAGARQVPKELRGLYQEVLDIHDEVMPKMSQLTSLQEHLTRILGELRAAQPIDNEKLRETNRILGSLNRAESAMWDWMDGFSKLDSVPDTDKEIFLKNEKSSAESMKELMLNSIEEAEKYLEENPEKPADAL